MIYRTPAIALPKDVRPGAFAPLRSLARFARPELGGYLLGGLFVMLSMGMTLLYPQFIGWIVNDVLHEGSVERIDSLALWMLLVLAVDGIAVFLRSYWFMLSAERTLARLRGALFENILVQETAFFDANRTGDLTSRLGTDATVVQEALRQDLKYTIRHAGFLVAGTALLLYTSPKLTLLVAVCAPLALAGVSFAGRRIQTTSRDVQESFSRAGQTAEESISGIRTLRRLGQERAAVARYLRSIDEALEGARHRIAIMSGTEGASTFVSEATIAVMLWLGAHLVGSGELTTGALVTFIIYASHVATSFSMLVGATTRWMHVAGAAERVFQTLDRKAAVDLDEGLRPDALVGDVELDAVNFRYPSRPDAPVLRDFDLRIPAGQRVALVGPSGGGKSTIAALVSRLYDVDSGAVRIDGRDVRQLAPNWLRQQIGSVEQEPVLFSASIAENVGYGRAGATEAEILAALEAANARDFVDAFPDRERTEVGERGVQLSGGQKQRIAIARAVLRDPKILILDEATSALDAESERLVQEALERLMRGRTVLVIAHRLSTVRSADRVVVVDQGRIAQSGSHEELSKCDGLYRELIQSQLEPT